MPLFVLLLTLGLAACADPSPTPSHSDDAPAEALVPYRLDTPDAVVELPPELREISGLSLAPSGRLAAVQDEDGIVFEVDPATGSIVDQLAFANAGDYEGVEIVPGGALWVLRSDGDLWRVGRDSLDQPTSRKIETALRGRNDTEGLAYHAATGRLLIACKEDPGPGLDDVRAVYAFDLTTEAVDEIPVVLLDRRQLDTDEAFKPSAIAIHPQTGELYVLSSVRTAIAVFDAGGTLVAVSDIPSPLAPQPEGIAFSPDGTLFLSSEGSSGPARLLRYAPTR
ncbi:MAG: SdiA-regulated domain-containing protein [Bacteroidota bacterium]